MAKMKGAPMHIQIVTPTIATNVCIAANDVKTTCVSMMVMSVENLRTLSKERTGEDMNGVLCCVAY